MPYIARGHVPLARNIAETNVALLAEAIRQGYTIVATEPSAVLALTHEYLQLLPDDQDAEMVSQNTYEACHYFWRLHQRRQTVAELRSAGDFARLSHPLPPQGTGNWHSLLGIC